MNTFDFIWFSFWFWCIVALLVLPGAPIVDAIANHYKYKQKKNSDKIGHKDCHRCDCV